MIIRDERSLDVPDIAKVVAAAFTASSHGHHGEAAIVDGLRDAGALTLSLVAVEGGALIGHVAFSPVRIGGEDVDWFGLGPVAVRPDRQGVGVGQSLVYAGLERLTARGAGGVVVLGEPDYYSRFGFAAHAALKLAGVPATHFMALVLQGTAPRGAVDYHAAFA